MHSTTQNKTASPAAKSILPGDLIILESTSCEFDIWDCPNHSGSRSANYMQLLDDHVKHVCLVIAATEDNGACYGTNLEPSNPRQWLCITTGVVVGWILAYDDEITVLS